ncbi:MAG: hypothetical protein AMJ54_16465 [Deltaproteobacteria bacterium SG8_13]|nr:MAG: hypothetical protein AMJ54_16465 [Deltaproteobacteria bacterium SG8_13]
MTAENDIVLIYLEDQPLSFARIEGILPDTKPSWYHVRMLLLQIPVQVVTWILRDVYIDGTEFTMNGKRMRLEKVEAPEQEPAPDEKTIQTAAKKSGGKLISLKDLKKD